MIKRNLVSFYHDLKGSAVVEGAVLVPVLMSLFLGVFEFSFVFYQQQLISTGVRDAARYLARVNDPTDPAAQTIAKNIATTGATSGGSPRVNGWTTSTITIAFNNDANTGNTTPCGTSPCNSGTMFNGNSVVQIVVVSTSFTDPTLGFFGFFGLTAPKINVSHAERVIGVG